MLQAERFDLLAALFFYTLFFNIRARITAEKEVPLY
jgi:hypothetical protein